MPELWLNFQEGDPREKGRIGKRTWSRVHWVLTALLVVASLQLHFWRPEPIWVAVAFVPAALAAFGLFIARLFHIPLTDFYGELSYRDRFFVFLLHIGLFLSPWMAGMSPWLFGTSLVLVALCLQAVNPVSFARIYALGFVLAAAACVAPPYPPLWLVAVWGAVYLLVLRSHHVTFRLLRLSRGPGTPVRAAAFETARSFVVPFVVALVAAIAAGHLWGGDIRQIVFAGVEGEAVQALPSESLDDLLIDLIILVALVAAAIGVLVWFEKFLRVSKKASAVEEEVALSVGESLFERTDFEEPPEREVEGRDPRGRVIRRFRKLTGALAKAGLARRPAETPLEYADRLSGKATALGEAGPALVSAMGVFNAACYSRREITEQQAESFSRAAEAAEVRGREREALKKAVDSAAERAKEG